MAAKGGAFSLKSFEKSLDSGGLKNVYLFYGPEEERISRAVKSIKERVIRDADPAFAWRIYDMAETPLGDLLTDLKTVSFFGGRRGVMAKNIATERGRAGAKWLDEADRNYLLEYMANPSPDVTLIIVTEKVDGRLKFWKDAKKHAHSIFFEAKDYEQKTIVAEKLGESGLRFSPDARLWMTERFYNRLSQMDSELEKLSVYLGGSTTAEVSDLEDCMGMPPLDSIFKLADEIAGGNADGSLQALKSLRMQGKTFYTVLPMIARHFRILLSIRSCKAQKLSDGETIRKCGVHSYFYGQYAKQAANFTQEELKGIICHLHRIDMRIRTSGMNDWMLLEEELIPYICGNKAA
ncbi:MAG: DNA polymerase III subunit delta [Nitrospinota bacterium]